MCVCILGDGDGDDTTDEPIRRPLCSWREIMENMKPKRNI